MQGRAGADLGCLGIWQGEDLTGRTLLIHAEEGLGDTLQFARFVPALAGRASRIVLAVQQPLVRLLQGLPGVDQVIATGATLPPFDALCPLLSLPAILRAGPDTIPAPPPLACFGAAAVPDHALPGHALPEHALRVGLVWHGSPSLLDDRHRSIDPQAFAVLAGIGNVQFVSLQKHEPARGRLPAALRSTDLLAGVTDFADTASRLQAIDLVITVDTAMAHLAATIGKPVWLLSRQNGCWRWMQDRRDSPWYPTVTLYRQTKTGEWGPVLQAVRRDLIATAHAHLNPGHSSHARLATAACTVLSSKQAIVIGPTPPGTGVIAPAVVTASA